MDSEIQKRIERKGIVISRLPEWAKEVFIARAKDEFCDDYGMCLASMVKECGEFNHLKQLFFEGKMNTFFGDSQEESEEKKIKFGSGKQVNLNGGKDGKNK